MESVIPAHLLWLDSLLTSLDLHCTINVLPFILFVAVEVFSGVESVAEDRSLATSSAEDSFSSDVTFLAAELYFSLPFDF